MTAKLNWEKVADINNRIAAGELDGPIALLFGVSRGTINFIRRKLTWQKR